MKLMTELLVRHMTLVFIVQFLVSKQVNDIVWMSWMPPLSTEQNAKVPENPKIHQNPQRHKLPEHT